MNSKIVPFLSLAAVAAIALVAIAACDRGSSKPEPGAATESALSPAARTSATGVLAAYEEIRALLARDAVSGLSGMAERLESAASSLASSSPAAMKPYASALVTAAHDLRSQNDIEQARVVFGEISRQVVSLLVVEPSLRENRRVYECPMAKGYKKWVQATANMENPYMGKAMLRCGAESEWAG